MDNICQTQMVWTYHQHKNGDPVKKSTFDKLGERKVGRPKRWWWIDDVEMDLKQMGVRNQTALALDRRK